MEIFSTILTCIGFIFVLWKRIKRNFDGQDKALVYRMGDFALATSMQFLQSKFPNSWFFQVNEDVNKKPVEKKAKIVINVEDEIYTPRADDPLNDSVVVNTNQIK